MPTIFTKIINREIPAHIVAENEMFIAILDINPLVLGHVLIIPKIEKDYIFDLDDDVLMEMNVFAKRISLAIQKTVLCKRIGVAVIGLEVPHVHMHLVPINTADDLNFTRPKLSPSQQNLAEIAEKIKAAL
ncbi:MAG: HIT family protein [Cyclobacteriaceae bacterium]|nr:HIT family protein [Cytophagales bacterium]MCZ8326582.1 HIT family protein [Cyclobacteriaceae bacterium]